MNLRHARLATAQRARRDPADRAPRRSPTAWPAAAETLVRSPGRLCMAGILQMRRRRRPLSPAADYETSGWAGFSARLYSRLCRGLCNANCRSPDDQICRPLWQTLPGAQLRLTRPARKPPIRQFGATLAPRPIELRSHGVLAYVPAENPPWPTRSEKPCTTWPTPATKRPCRCWRRRSASTRLEIRLGAIHGLVVRRNPEGPRPDPRAVPHVQRPRAGRAWPSRSCVRRTACRRRCATSCWPTISGFATARVA